MSKCNLKSFLVFLVLSGTVSFLYFFIPQLLGRDEIQTYGDSWKYYVAYPNKYRFILDHPQKCQQNKPFIVVIVPASPHNTEARRAIRRTWGNDSLVQHGTVLVLFLLGLPSGNETQQHQVLQENQRHQDLLQGNFIDSYRNLTIKSMVMLQWLRDRCPQAFYAVKVDDDVLLNIRGLMMMVLGSNLPQSRYITGLVWYNNIVIRDPANKFFIPHNVYANSVYPPYPLGMCYIMSMDLPEKILQASNNIKPIFLEDVYIGLCLERLKIAPTDPPDPGQFVVNPPKYYNRCYYAKLIAVLTYSSEQLVSYWTDIQKPDAHC